MNRAFKILFVVIVFSMLYGCPEEQDITESNNFGGDIYFGLNGSSSDLTAYRYNPQSRQSTRILAYAYNLIELSNGDFIFISAEGGTKGGIYRTNSTFSTKIPILLNDGIPATRYDWEFNNLEVWEEEELIVYEGNSSSIYVCDFDGNILFHINEDGNGPKFAYPSFTKDGYLLLEGGFGNEGIYLLNLETFKYSPVLENLVNPKNPTLSPDGQKICFSMNNQLWIYDLNTEQLEQLTTGAGSVRYPCWSPDGKAIAASGTGGALLLIDLINSEIEQVQQLESNYPNFPGIPDNIKITWY